MGKRLLVLEVDTLKAFTAINVDTEMEFYLQLRRVYPPNCKRRREFDEWYEAFPEELIKAVGSKIKDEA